MTKRLCPLLLLTLALAGCALGGSGKAFPRQYRLETTSAAAAAATPARRLPLVLRVARPGAPGWLHKTNLYYQLLYQQQSQVLVYTRSRWVQPPLSMLGQSLQTALADTHAFKAVTGPDAGTLATDLVLRTNLLDFVQRFESPSRSEGLLDARVTLTDVNTGRVLDQKEFRYRVAAPTADALGGVQALTTASSRFAKAVTQWVKQVLARCRPGCVAPAAAQGQ